MTEPSPGDPLPPLAPVPAAAAARIGLGVAIGAWLGAMAFFAAVMAPAAFAVLDGPAQAGRIVARTLGVLNLAGAVVGIGLALGARRLHTPAWLQVLPLVLGMLCITSHFGVTAALAEIRATPDWQIDPDLRRRFGQLHGVSVALLGATFLGVLALAIGHARAPSRAAKPSENLKNA